MKTRGEGSEVEMVRNAGRARQNLKESSLSSTLEISSVERASSAKQPSESDAEY